MTRMAPTITRSGRLYSKTKSSSATRPPLLSRRRLQIVLGLLWLLDGALQLQSFMFSAGFAKSIIAPSANGQPIFVSAPVEWNAHLIAAHPVLLNAAFASVQLLLGVGFLFRRSARIAIVGSIAWGSGTSARVSGVSLADMPPGSREPLCRGSVRSVGDGGVAATTLQRGSLCPRHGPSTPVGRGCVGGALGGTGRAEPSPWQRVGALPE